MMKKIFFELYSFFKDIFLFPSYSHKVPISTLFNKLPYQKVRILIDIFLTKKSQNKILNNAEDNKKKDLLIGEEDGIILNEGYFSENQIEQLKSMSNNLIENYKKHNLNVDDGGLIKMKIRFQNIIIYQV